jgi:hypothetical protein
MHEESIRLGICPLKLFHYDVVEDKWKVVLKYERYKGGAITGYIVWYE